MPSIRADARRKLHYCGKDIGKAQKHLIDLTATYTGEHPKWAERFEVIATALELQRQIIIQMREEL